MGDELEHEGDDSVDNDGTEKGGLLEWVLRQILPAVPLNYRRKERQDLAVRVISFLYGERDVVRLDPVLAMLLRSVCIAGSTQSCPSLMLAPHTQVPLTTLHSYIM